MYAFVFTGEKRKQCLSIIYGVCLSSLCHFTRLGIPIIYSHSHLFIMGIHQPGIWFSYLNRSMVSYNLSEKRVMIFSRVIFSFQLCHIARQDSSAVPIWTVHIHSKFVMETMTVEITPMSQVSGKFQCWCMHFLTHWQRFKIIDFLMGLWDPCAMILMGPRALGMGPIIDIF